MSPLWDSKRMNFRFYILTPIHSPSVRVPLYDPLKVLSTKYLSTPYLTHQICVSYPHFRCGRLPKSHSHGTLLILVPLGPFVFVLTQQVSGKDVFGVPTRWKSTWELLHFRGLPAKSRTRLCQPFRLHLWSFSRLGRRDQVIKRLTLVLLSSRCSTIINVG